MLPDGSTLPAGREFLDDGTWSGVFARFDTTGEIDSTFAGMPAFSAWGDNSVRSIAVQSDGKPVLVGYTGVDASGVPGPFAMRLTTAGRPDASYGNGGETLIDFDPQDNASGQALGAAIDAQGRVVMVGIYFTGASSEGGQDVTQIFVARLQGDLTDRIFSDGFDG